MIWTHKVVFGGSEKRFLDHLCIDEAWTVLPIVSRPIDWVFQCNCLHQIIDVRRTLMLTFANDLVSLNGNKDPRCSKCPKYSASVQTDDLSIVYHSLNLSGFSAATSSSSCLKCGCWSPAWTIWNFARGLKKSLFRYIHIDKIFKF